MVSICLDLISASALDADHIFPSLRMGASHFPHWKWWTDHYATPFACLVRLRIRGIPRRPSSDWYWHWWRIWNHNH